MPLLARYKVTLSVSVFLRDPQIGAGFGAPPAAMPASFNAPVSGGLDDLFDLGGGVGMPMGVNSPPKSVSLYKLGQDIKTDESLQKITDLVSVKVWLPAMKAKGLEISGTFVRRAGVIQMEMTLTNKAMSVMTDFAIQFNRNR